MSILTYTFKSAGGNADWSGWTQTPTSPATEALSSGIPVTTLGTGHKNVTAANNKWTLSGTWESIFGIPAGSIITGVTSASLQSKCTAFTTGGTTHTLDAGTLVDGATSITLNASRSFTATEGSFTTSNGTNSTGLSLASSDSITLTVGNSLSNGNSNSATMALQHDNLTLTISYWGPGRYVVAPGTWDGTNTAIWSDATGGTSGAPVPTSSNDVFLDGNSGVGTVTVDLTASNRPCKSMDHSGYTGTFALNGSNFNLQIAGPTLKFASGATYTGSLDWIEYTGTATLAVTSNGAAPPYRLYSASNSGTPKIQFQDSYVAIGGILDARGSVAVDFNNLSHTFLSYLDQSSGTLTMGSGTITIDAQLDLGSHTGSISAGTSTFKFTSGQGTSYNLGGLTVNNVWFATNSGGSFVGANNPTMNDLKIDAGLTVLFVHNQTYALTTFTVPASGSNAITINSDDNTNPFTISCASGTIRIYGTTVKHSTATGGATFDAFTADGNVDGGGNTGWNFTTPQSIARSAAFLQATASKITPSKVIPSASGGKPARNALIPVSLLANRLMSRTLLVETGMSVKAGFGIYGAFGASIKNGMLIPEETRGAFALGRLIPEETRSSINIVFGLLDAFGIALSRSKTIPDETASIIKRSNLAGGSFIGSSSISFNMRVDTGSIEKRAAPIATETGSIIASKNLIPEETRGAFAIGSIIPEETGSAIVMAYRSVSELGTRQALGFSIGEESSRIVAAANSAPFESASNIHRAELIPLEVNGTSNFNIASDKSINLEITALRIRGVAIIEESSSIDKRAGAIADETAAKIVASNSIGAASAGSMSRLDNIQLESRGSVVIRLLLPEESAAAVNFAKRVVEESGSGIRLGQLIPSEDLGAVKAVNNISGDLGAAMRLATNILEETSSTIKAVNVIPEESHGIAASVSFTVPIEFGIAATLRVVVPSESSSGARRAVALFDESSSGAIANITITNETAATSLGSAVIPVEWTGPAQFSLASNSTLPLEISAVTVRTNTAPEESAHSLTLKATILEASQGSLQANNNFSSEALANSAANFTIPLETNAAALINLASNSTLPLEIGAVTKVNGTTPSETSSGIRLSSPMGLATIGSLRFQKTITLETHSGIDFSAASPAEFALSVHGLAKIPEESRGGVFGKAVIPEEHIGGFIYSKHLLIETGISFSTERIIAVSSEAIVQANFEIGIQFGGTAPPPVSRPKRTVRIHAQNRTLYVYPRGIRYL